MHTVAPLQDAWHSKIRQGAATGESRGVKAEQIVKARRAGGTRYVEEVDVEPGFMLEMVNGEKVSDLDCLMQYYEDADSTGNISMVFVRGEGKFVPPPCPLRAKTEAAPIIHEAEEDVEELEWICGGKCGKMVPRSNIRARYDNVKGIPKEVFCRACAVKVHRSWRAKACGVPGCDNLVSYREFVLEVQAVEEPKFCKPCKGSLGPEWVVEAVDNGWRLKKCNHGRKAKAELWFEVSTKKAVVPKKCDECGGKEDENDFDQLQDTSDDENHAWPAIADEWRAMAFAAHRPPSQEKPSQGETFVRCVECDREVECYTYECQLKHRHFVCDSNKCDKAIETKGVNYNKKCGKDGKKRLDFAKHRQKVCCMLCGYIMDKSETKRHVPKIEVKSSSTGVQRSPSAEPDTQRTTGSARERSSSARARRQ